MGRRAMTIASDVFTDDSLHEECIIANTIYREDDGHCFPIVYNDRNDSQLRTVRRPIGKKMRRAFSTPENILCLILIGVSKSFLNPNVEGTQHSSLLNLCSAKHCRECDKSEFSSCSNDASSNRCGDLCGCCQSCVQSRDSGESCGSQLAVRYSSDDNFRDSESRIGIIATTSCRRGLICMDFVCRLKSDKIESVNAPGIKIVDQISNVDVDNFSVFLESKNEDSKLKNQMQSSYRRYNRNGDNGDSNSMENIFFNLGSRKNETFCNRMVHASPDSSNYESQRSESHNPEILFGPSRRFLNLIIAEREFQLIYGHDALADLQILLNTVNKTQPNSIINQLQAQNLFESFKNILRYINEKNTTTNVTKNIDLFPKNPEMKKNPRNKKKMFSINIIKSKKCRSVEKLILRQVERFRTKRESKNGEKYDDNVESKHKNGDQRNYSKIEFTNERENGTNEKFSYYDLPKQFPKKIKDVDGRWRAFREMNEGDELSTAKKIKLGDVGLVMNIHANGVPSPVNSVEDSSFKSDRERNARKKMDDDDYVGNDERSELHVAEANAEFSEKKIVEEPRKSIKNSTLIKTDENANTETIDKIIDDDRNASTTKCSNVFDDFSSSENLKIMEKNIGNGFNIRVNDTVDEFRRRLDRIETRIVAIGNSIFDVVSEFRSDEESEIIGDANIQNFDDTINVEGPKVVDESAIRNWRTVLVGPNFLRAKKNFNVGKIRSNEVGNRNSNRQHFSHHRKFTESSPRDSNPGKWTNDDKTKFPNRISSSIISSNVDYRNFEKYFPSSFGRQNSMSLNGLFARESSSFETVAETFPARYLVSNRRTSGSLSGDRNGAPLLENDEKITDIRKIPTVVESIVASETQIPEPFRSELSNNADRGFEEPQKDVEDVVPASMVTTVVRSLDVKRDEGFVDDDWASESFGNWDAGPSLNLFVVDGRISDVQPEASSNIENLSAAYFGTTENNRRKMGPRNFEMDQNWDHIYPDYLDYSERMEKSDDGESTVETQTAETPLNDRRTRIIPSDPIVRKKRTAKINSHVVNENIHLKNISNTKKNETEKFVTNETMIRNLNETSSNKVDDVSFIAMTNFDDGDDGIKKKMIEGWNITGLRWRRGVQMVDWLRAAEEYHERLQQVRTAAMKTWLASREQLDDGSLTNVELFTRELPDYLEKYRRDSVGDESIGEIDNDRHHFSDRPENSERTMSEKSVEKILSNESSKSNNDSKFDDDGETSSSTLPRKFTIITMGNSTIRIESMPENRKTEKIRKWNFDDQRESGTMDSGAVVDRRTDSSFGRTEDFDHMYESFDTDDEDFDYENPRFEISEFLEGADLIEDSTFETADDGSGTATSRDYFEGHKDDDIAKLSRRSKRDAPFFLFKRRDSPSQEVAIWPSNWKDVISRHLKVNRSKNFTTRSRKPSRRSHVKLSKVSGNFRGAESSVSTKTFEDEIN